MGRDVELLKLFNSVFQELFEIEISSLSKLRYGEDFKKQSLLFIFQESDS